MKYCFAIFLLVAVFSPSSPSVAVTFMPVYVDGPGEGVNDPTVLTETQKAVIRTNGNDAETLGEARRNAIQEAFRILGNKLLGDFTIKVKVNFRNFPMSGSGIPLAAAQASCFFILETISGQRIVFPSSLLVPFSRHPNVNRDDVQVLCGEDNIERYDISITINDEGPLGADPDDSPSPDIFYYGFDVDAPRFTFNFVSVVVHELFHGLGFFELVKEDGSWSILFVDGDGNPLPLPSIYDYLIYSVRDGDFLVNLTEEQRRGAVISGENLLWDGRGFFAPCSYSRLVGRRDKTGGVSNSGRPILYAPSLYNNGSSVSHLHTSVTPDDIMEPFLPPGTREITLALALLKDMGWEINDRNIPTSCTSPPEPPEPPGPPPRPRPTPVLSIEDAVVVEGDQGLTDAIFDVTLSSASTREVRVDYSTVNGTAIAGTDYVAVYDRLIFMPGDIRKEIAVEVMGDTLNEMDETFIVRLSRPIEASLGDEMATGTIRDDDDPSTEGNGEGGGCGIAGEEISSRNVAAGHLFLALIILFVTLHGKIGAAEKRARRLG